MSIKSGQLLFISILKDFINKKPSVIENIQASEWDEIKTLALKHSMGAIVYYQTKEKSLMNSYVAQLYYDTNRKAEYERISSILDENGIQYVPVKGAEISKYYPVPAVRSMGDVDLVVHIEDKEKVADILSDLGYEASRIGMRAWNFWKQDIEIELHHQLMYDRDLSELQMDFCNDCWTYVKENVMDDSFHFLFTVLHLEKHMMGEGVGIRQFMDVALLTKNNIGINWKWVQQKFLELNSLDYLKTILYFNEQWFDVRSPLGIRRVPDEFFEEVTAQILNDGVFGFGNSNNKQNDIVNQLSKYGKLKVISMFFRRIFPSYRVMAERKEYPFLNRLPIILPICWIHRIITNWNKKESVRSEYFVDDNIVKSRKEFFLNMGIKAIL